MLILASNCIRSKFLRILTQLSTRIAIMRFAFKIKSASVKIFSLENIEIFDLIKTIFFLIFLIFLTFFFFRSRFLRLLFFVLFFVAFLNSLLSFNFLFFVFFFVVFLLNLFLKNMLSLLLLDSCLKTRSLKKNVNLVDLLIAILFLFLTKILYLSLMR